MKIVPYPLNAKEHTDKQVKDIAESIRHWGFVQKGTVDKHGVIIAGHGRYKALTLLGIEPEIGKHYDVLDVEGEEANALRFADNKLNESKWIKDLTYPELSKLSYDLQVLTGFDMDRLITSSDEEDAIPAVPTDPVSRLGDIYKLGSHTLICGDSTDERTYMLLPTKADIVFTSPPYNIGSDMYENYKDDLSNQKWEDFIVSVLKNCADNTKGLIFWNISYNKNNKKDYLKILSNLIDRTGLLFRELIAWDKGTAMPITDQAYLTRSSEQIIVMSKDDTSLFNKDKGEYTNTWHTKPNRNLLDNHKACYPVELVEKAILTSTKTGDIVLEPFNGSGTNIIACEKTKRNCYAIELDPGYCDATIQRYVDFTKNETITKNGETIIWETKK